MTDHWYETLRRTMDAATGQPQPPSELIREALGAARSCDPRSEDEVVQALVELSRLAWHGVAASDPAADEVMLAAADLALAAYLEGGLNGPLRGVAREWHRRGRTAQAINLLDESRRLAAEHGVGAEPRAAVATLHGDLLRQHGELDAAEVALLDALAEVGAVSGVDPALVSTLLNNLGLVRQERGDLTQALADLIASLEVDGLEQDAGSLAVTLDNLGRLETELARRAGPLWIDADLVNGVTDEHLRRAEEYFVRATELFQEGLPETAEDYVICLLNRADAAELRADAAQRDQLSSTALEEALRLPVSAATAWSVAALRGEVLLDRGRPDEAAQLMGRWFTHLAPTVSMGVAQAAGLAMLVTAAAVAGDDELAGRVAADLAGLDSWLLEGLLASGSQAELRHRFRAFAQRAELVLGACLPREPSGIAADWLYELVLNRKGLLAEREGSAWLHARRSESGGALFEEVRRLRADLAHLDLGGDLTGSIREARQRYERTERALNDAEARLFRDGADRLRLPRVGLDDLRARLGGGVQLLEIATVRRPGGECRYVVFDVRSTGPVGYRDLGEVGEVDGRLRALTEELSRPPHAGAARRGLDPAGLDLLGDTVRDRILIAPTGVWAGVPFGAWPDADARDLIERHLVTLVPSGRRLVTGAPEPSRDVAAGRPVVFADPDFDRGIVGLVDFPVRGRAAGLPRTAAEAMHVVRAIGGTYRVGGDATRRALLAVRRPRVLHLATHGTFIDAIGSLREQSEPRSHVIRHAGPAVVTEENHDHGWVRAREQPDGPDAVHRRRVEWLESIGPRSPLSRSVLQLAGFNAWLTGLDTPDEVGNGMISAVELGLLELSGTELVVLSGCETGAGAVDYADGGHLGLRGAALAAGAARCISTLWTVHDADAADLNAVFYTAMAAGAAPEDALRTAQLALRKRFPDPHYWAGWILESVGR